MTGMSFHPKLAFQAGGFLTTIMAFILILKSREALTKDYRRTEMWLYIEKDFRPPEAYAQWASATVLRDTYLTFAMWTSLISIAMWVIALVFMLLGTESVYSLERDGGNSNAFVQQTTAPATGAPFRCPRFAIRSFRERGCGLAVVVTENRCRRAKERAGEHSGAEDHAGLAGGGAAAPRRRSPTRRKSPAGGDHLSSCRFFENKDSACVP